MNYYIKGNKERGAEVIAALEDRGGVNHNCCSGSAETAIYYTNKRNEILVATTLDIQITVKQFCEELTLPEKWTPKFKVGDKVEFTPSLNSAVRTIGTIKGINVKCKYYNVLVEDGKITDKGMYYWSEEHLILHKWQPQRGETVLVRQDETLPWKEGIFSFYHESVKSYCVVGGIYYYNCIPFDLNKLGKVTED